MLSKFADIEVKSDPNLIRNPFMCGSSKPIRLSLDKDPKSKVGNTEYCHTVMTGEETAMIINEIDPRLSFAFGKEKKKEYTSGTKMDYQVPVEVLNEKCKYKKHKDGLPLSFIQIKTEEEGIEWYEGHYPKIPKDLLPIIARYHWGAPITKKGIKNEKKKIERKIQQKGLKVEHKKVSLKFQ
jgi:hypothetical protein